jgi:hypothetical protein
VNILSIRSDYNIQKYKEERKHCQNVLNFGRKNTEKQVIMLTSTIKNLLHDFFPDKRVTKTSEDEVKKMLQNILDYVTDLCEQAKKGKVVPEKEIVQGLFLKLGIEIDEKRLKDQIDSIKLTNFLNYDLEDTNIKEYIVFFNNLIEVAYAKHRNKELILILANVNIPEIMGFYQYICSKLEENIEFLFKKSFRYSSQSVSKLIEVYGTLSGYYEIFIKLMVLTNDLVYDNEPFLESRYEWLSNMSKKNFNGLVKITKRIPDFDVFREPYDRTLRNKIIHKDFRIDYKNKLIQYSSEKITFKDLLLKTKNLQAIFFSYSLLFTFDMRKNLQSMYNLLINEDKSTLTGAYKDE